MSKLNLRNFGMLSLAAVMLAGVGVGLLIPRLNTTGLAERRMDAASVTRSAKTVSTAALIEPAGAARAGAVEAAGRIPRSAELVVVIDRGAELRGSRLGESAARFVAEAGGLAQSRSSWSALALQLGWTEGELFDRLLGQRVVLVARPAADRSTMLWVLLSDVSEETDARLKQRLEASPRAIDQGHQILSLEKGKYELTSHRRSAADGAGITIVLGPTGRSELFDEMVSQLASPTADTLEGTEVLNAAAQAGSPEFLLISRLRADSPAIAPRKPGEAARTSPPRDDAATRTAGPEGGAAWSGFFVLAGERGRGADGSELNARVIYRDPSQQRDNLEVPVSSDAVFASLAPDSVLTVFQAAPLHSILGLPSSTLDFLRDLPKNLPETSRALLGSRQLFSLRKVGGAAAGGGQRGAEIDGGPAVRCAAIVGLEANQTYELAPSLDGAIARFVHSLEQGSGLVQPTPHDFAGQMPQVTRVMPIKMGDGSLIRLVSAAPLALAWSYSLNNSVSESAGSNSGPGWWLVSAAPMSPGQERLPADEHRKVVSAVISAEAGERARWVWLGSARPVELESMLPAIIPDAGGFRSAMKRFESAELRVSINSAGDLQGDLKLRLGETVR